MALGAAVRRTGPSLFPKIWHGHYGKIAIGWGLLTLLPVAVFHGVSTMLAAFVHVIVAEYLSFIALLFALYTVAGGILVTGTIRVLLRRADGREVLGQSGHTRGLHS